MLKGTDKAAAILSLLGEEISQKILGFLPEETAVIIIKASENLQMPTKEVLLGVVSEFNVFMKDTVVSSEIPASPQSSVEKPKKTGTPLEQISAADPATLAGILEKERPEISAYVLSHLSVEKIYDILNMLKESRESVEARLVSIKDVPVAKELEESILKSFSERLP